MEKVTRDGDSFRITNYDEESSSMMYELVAKTHQILKSRHNETECGDLLTESERFVSNSSALDSVSKGRLSQVVRFMKETNYRCGGGTNPKPKFDWMEFQEYLKLQHTIQQFNEDTVDSTPLDELYKNIGFKNRFIANRIKKQLGINGGWSLLAKRYELISEVSSSSNSDIKVVRDLQILLKLSKYLSKKTTERSTSERISPSAILTEELRDFVFRDFHEYCLVDLQRSIVKRAVVLGCDPRIFEPAWCKSLLSSVAAKLKKNPLTSRKEENFLYGPTQVGKTQAKAVIAWICYAMVIPCIIITKGKECATNLTSNLQSKNLNVFSTCEYTEQTWKKRTTIPLRDELCMGGTLVIPNTFTQLDRATDLVEWMKENITIRSGRKPIRKFLLLVDEVDDLHRTDLKKSQELSKMEKSYKKLLKKGPLCQYSTTATPLSVWIEVYEHPKKRETLTVFEIQRDSNYIGIRDLDTRAGTFLEEKELNGNDGYLYQDHPIPFTTEATIEFYKDAIALAAAGKKGVLACNIANRKVYVDDNVRDEANGVQNFFADKGIHIIIVVCIGPGIHFRIKEEKAKNENVDTLTDPETLDPHTMYRAPQHWTLSVVLKLLDEKFGLETPIFVFGCMALGRGVSVRSNNRVLTHLQIGLGSGHSMAGIVQAMGRATGNVRDVLEKNFGVGFRPKILMTEKDFLGAQKYINDTEKTIYEGESSADNRTFTLPIVDSNDIEYSNPTKRRLGQQLKRNSSKAAKRRRGRLALGSKTKRQRQASIGLSVN